MARSTSALALRAASAQSAAIEGMARVATCLALPGVTAEAQPAGGGDVRTVMTGGNGRFTTAGLPPGAYDVTFTLPGFRTVVLEGVATEARPSRRSSRHANVSVERTGYRPTAQQQAEVPSDRGNGDSARVHPSGRGPRPSRPTMAGAGGRGRDVGEGPADVVLRWPTTRNGLVAGSR